MIATRTIEAFLPALPIDDIRASSTNPRQHFDPAGLDELKISIQQLGIQVPLLVRPLHDQDPGDAVAYELVCGERRLRAAKELGLAGVPVIVRELSDAEAREAQIVENLQRAGVHPLEEAEAFNELLKRLGSIAAVAARMGKEQSYIAKSLRLLALTVWSQDALREGLITIEHALLLARLADAEQNDALKWTLDCNAGSKTTVDKVIGERLEVVRKSREAKPGDRFHGYAWEPATVQRLKSHIIGDAGTELSRAPWNVDADVLLDGVPACAACDKNTKANTPLFGDLDIGEPTCTDGACFQAKTAAFVQIKLREAGFNDAVKPPVLVPRLSWKASSVKPAICGNDLRGAGIAGMSADPLKALKQGQWVEAKKDSCPNVRVGVFADWSDSGDRRYGTSERKLRKPGESLLVCIAQGCKVHRKEWEKPKGSTNSAQQQHDVEAEKRLKERRAAIGQEEPKIRSKIFSAILAKLDAPRAIRLLADRDSDAPGWRKRIMAELPKLDGQQLEALTLFALSFDRALSVNEYWMARDGAGAAGDRKDLWVLAKSLGVNADAIAAKHFHDAGSIAPAVECLYPKGIPWPKKGDAPQAAKKAVGAKKTATKPAPKKAAPAKKTTKAPAAKAATPPRKSAGAAAKKASATGKVAAK